MLISFIAFIFLWRMQQNKKQESEIQQLKEEDDTQSTLLTANHDELVVKIEDNKKERFTLRTIIYLLVILWTSILLIGCNSIT